MCNMQTAPAGALRGLLVLLIHAVRYLYRQRWLTVESLSVVVKRMVESRLM